MKVLDRLDEASATGLVAEANGQVGRFAFEHALVRTAIVDGLGTTRRLRLHQRIGDTLVASGSDDVAALAHHYLEAAVSGRSMARCSSRRLSSACASC